jgi:8-oxo-dGTP pyrophosphatase MutT (NUDIX family)
VSSREDLIRALEAHEPFDAHEAAMLASTLAFVRTQEACFDRALECGHVTGSAWVVNTKRTQTLLVHHAQLDRWLQPGGHCDGNPDVMAVALQETLEETGLTATPVFTSLFDVDTHQIPGRKGQPAHIHYDVRFLVEADDQSSPTVSEESHDVRWMPLESVKCLNTDDSVLRMVAKTRLSGALQP